MLKRLLLLLGIVSLLQPQCAEASSFIKDKQRYTAQMGGKDIIVFKLPTFDYWRVSGNVYITGDTYIESTVDGVTKKIFWWKSKGSNWEDKSMAWAEDYGTFVLMRDHYGKDYDNWTLTSGQWSEFMLGSDLDDSDHKTMTIHWKVPYEWQGKKISLRASVVWEEALSRSDPMDVSLGEFTTSPPPAVNVMLMEPMLAFEKGHVGETILPYSITARKVNSITAYYTDRATDEKKSMTVNSTALSGYIYLPAGNALKDFYLKCNIVDNDGNTLDIQSDNIKIPPLHQAKNFCATLQPNAQMKLTWQVDNPQLEDIVEGDFWEIQRNLSGNSADDDSQWKTIAQLNYETEQAYYSYTDEDFLNSYTGNTVYYRIRRMATSIWGWSTETGRVVVSMDEKPYLQMLTNVGVRKMPDWNKDGHHGVEISWDRIVVTRPNADNMKQAKIGYTLGMDGRAYSTRTEADQQGGGTWGVIVAGGEGRWMAWKTGWTWDLDLNTQSPKKIYEGQPVPKYFKRVLPTVEAWNDILKSNDCSGSISVGSGQQVTLANLANMLSTARTDGRNFEGLAFKMYVCLDGKDDEYILQRYGSMSSNKYELITLRKLNIGVCTRDLVSNYDVSFYHNWDSRARLLLYIDMKNSAGKVVATECRDLSSDTSLIRKCRYQMELTRKCVDYDFRLVIKRGSSPLRFYNSDADSIVYAVTKQETGDAASYKFINVDSITDLSARQLQNTVELTWKNTGGDSDFYRVMRREHGTEAAWDTLGTNLTQLFYIDKKPRPQHVYDYRVESVLQCEELSVNGQTCTGQCAPTGMVRGYVRLADGTGLGGLTVKAEPIGDIAGAAIVTAVTDSTGYFQIGGLVYQHAGSYRISVSSMGDGGTFTPQTVSFDEDVNLQSNFVFTLNTYYIYSGNIYYEGSTIPVPGVQFRRDGVLVVDANQQPITTDNQGAFALSIPKGTHRVQAVKAGHRFKNEGYLLNPDSQTGDQRDYNWTKDVASVRLWDETRVLLHGRVVGGNDQGQLPLGQSLSRNNLGDSLKIVLMLEGDNTSYIVFDQQDPTKKERSETFAHGSKDTTVVYSNRRSISIRPDKKTGEYEAWVYPVKYKVTEVSATGYSTLFQEGKVGETLDLTARSLGDTALYSRIYHAIPSLDIVQFNPGGENYMGVKQYQSMDNIGNKSMVQLWDKESGYAFGAPVFMAGSPYGWMLQAVERYHYNNDSRREADVVNLKGGQVTFNNGLVGNDAVDKVTLDSIGGGSYVFTPQNTTFTQEGDQARKTVSITLLYDNAYFNVPSVKGYVMAYVAKPNGNRIVAKGIPHLVDILRDPPGAGSSAYLEAGTKLSYAYSASIDASAGLSLTSETGTGANYYQGIIGMTGVTGTEAGTLNNVEKTQNFSIALATNFGWSWNYSYGIDITERIQTSSDKKWVGPKADLFIGLTDNLVMQDAVAVRVVPDSIYQLMSTRQGGTFTTKSGDKVTVKTGTMKVLAEGEDATGSPVYLIRDEVMGVGAEVTSTFVYSQFHIETELLPNLLKVRNGLLLPKGTTPEYAQALADKQKAPTYLSTVGDTDDDFGLEGSYEQFVPKGTDKTKCRDSICALNDEIYAWLKFLVKNEEEKLGATDLIKNYDVDGLANVQYSETFTCTADRSRYLRWPISNNLNIGGIAGSVEPLMKMLDKLFTSGEIASGSSTFYDDNNVAKVSFTVLGAKTTLKFRPIATINLNDKNDIKEAWSKKTGFTLAMSAKSSLNVDVLRTKSNIMDLGVGDTINNVFYKLTANQLNQVRYGTWVGLGSNTTSYMDILNTPIYSGFVYRTRGGATSQPYEDQRVTQYYNPGTVLDTKTTEIDKLRIWTEQASVSNVPFDEPARFTLYLANESDMPDKATKNFKCFLDNSRNKKGAKVFMDGNALNGDGYTIVLQPGQVVTKQLEVLPNSDFDYEDIGISLYDTEDIARVFTTLISAHFVPSAGKVKIATPGDKWVINTESSYDAKRQSYFLPVRIEGFDVNYRGFDHIELQYKLSTQGDKDWVNVCSFYNDRQLMAQASGMVDSIPSDGAIQTRFFGETDPIEQRYDLRAVVYCRYGNGFLTASSPILSGIKDTRRPVPFGTPQPQNGILGIGDDIKIAFSEPIAGNYLSAINNFEVLGTPNGGDISLSTQLSFGGNTMAWSQADCNLSGKSFTVDMMINPALTDRDMIIYSHGNNETGVRLGVTPDHRLTAVVCGNQITSTPIAFNGIRQVALTVQQNKDDMIVRLYDGNTLVAQGSVEGASQCNDAFCLGFDFDMDDKFVSYRGEMLEFRLWNRCLSSAELGEYGQKTLTGYEHGLVVNYALNEGTGDYSYDRTVGGNDLDLSNHTWRRPDGISVRIDGSKGLRLKPDCFNRTDYQDYTLMFWFRTGDRDATLMANGEAKTEPDARNHFNIGLRNGMPVFRSGGREVATDISVNDNAWHHYAMTVSRSRNVGNIYIDKELVQTFAVDTLGGIMGNNLALGATYTSSTECERVLTGNIDEVAMFESVLPQNMLQTYALQTPSGSETALTVWLEFGRSRLQDDGTQRLMPTGISLKRYKDARGNIITLRNDTIVPQDVIETYADRSQHAPMTSTRKQDNVRFSYVADGKDLLLNLDVPDNQIEKSNVFVTVRDVADQNGNTMASPLTMQLYVYRNPLRWNVKRAKVEADYGRQTSFAATIRNLSGERQTFELRDLPLWIKASKTQGVIPALDEEDILFEVSPYINVGTYNEVVSLVGENGMTEPLPVSIHVSGEAPDWAVDSELKRKNEQMHIIARVMIDGHVAVDPNDILAVTGPSQEVMGVAHVDVDQTANANEALCFLTVYGYPNRSVPLSFRFYDASKGMTYLLREKEGRDVEFLVDSIVGTSREPLVLTNSSDIIQTIKLEEGWNWVSAYIVPSDSVTIGQLLYGTAPWETGDVIEVVTPAAARAYYCRASKTSPGYKWDKDRQKVKVDPTLMYRIYAKSAKKAIIVGNRSKRGIVVQKGWNRIGYVSPINLPISQALSGYVPYGSEGDVVKSQDAFAMLSRNSAGQLVWKGTLAYMEQGRGYMLKRKGSEEVVFSYPQYYGDSRYAGVVSDNYAPIYQSRAAATMNIVAVPKGIELQEGDLLTVYNDGELCGVAEADADGTFYLNIGAVTKASHSDNMKGGSLIFRIERNGETIAATQSGITYQDDVVMGTPEEPKAVNFTEAGRYDDGRWYTVDGRLLPEQPKRSGLYIHNGKIEMIEQ